MCSSNVIKQGFLKEEAKYEDLSNLFIYLNRNYTQAILVNSVNFSFYCNLIYIYIILIGTIMITGRNYIHARGDNVIGV